jgi:hypothetical protein
VPNVGRKKGKRKKKGGRNNGPARQRYWQYGRLEENKVRRIMRATGMTREAARKYWREMREGRRMKNHMKNGD